MNENGSEKGDEIPHADPECVPGERPYAARLDGGSGLGNGVIEDTLVASMMRKWSWAEELVKA